MSNFKTKATALLIALLFTVSANAETTSDNTQMSIEQQIEQLKLSIDSLKLNIEQRDETAKSTKSTSIYKPNFFGVILATLNISDDDGATRFNVRNSRFGVKGLASKELSYAIQIDFNNQGSVSVLDSYVGYTHGDVCIKLGQQAIHLTQDYDRGPSSNLFTTRTFAAIYSTSYYGEESLKTLGSRDIGAYGTYTISGVGNGNIPITLSAGAFNGTGTNNPQWDKSVNYTARITAGGKEGVFAAASYYGGNTPFDQSIEIYSAEVSYNTKTLFAEAILQRRNLSEADTTCSTTFAVVQGYYNIATPNSTIFQTIAPTLRWDYGKNMGYLNLASEADESASDFIESLNVHRISANINFNLTEGRLRSRISIGYEKIFMNHTPSDISWNRLMQDKFTLGFAAAF